MSKRIITVQFAAQGGEVKQVNLPQGSRVEDVLRFAKHERRKGETVSLNGKPIRLGGLLRDPGPKVKDGDRVTVSPNIEAG